ncbi:MAG: peptidoglycan DD-metalloendopeptidase family protein [Ruminococcus sp.]|nr:peptidoglycan DD-metalloendopeptidase family protein [Ruminococcus sp.]
MNTKFITVNGYNEIEELNKIKKASSKSGRASSANSKKKLQSTLLLAVIYILLTPVRVVKNFSLKNLTVKQALTGYAFPAVSILLLVITVVYWTQYVNFGLKVQRDGETVALVADTGVIEKAREITSDKLSDDIGEEFTPVYQVTVVDKDDSADKVSNAIVSNEDSVSDNLAGLYVNDELIGVCSSADELNEKLDSLIAVYKEKYDDKTEVGFSNEVEVKEGIFNNDELVTVDELIEKAQSEKQIQVLVKTEIIETETIPYETKTTYDKNKDSSYQKVKQKGVNGKQETTYMVSYLDGVQIDAVVKNVKTTQKPVEKIIVKGKGSKASSKTYKSTVSSSGFMWPVPSVHTISSTYGYREGGEFHTGLDIADGNCYGATIVASKAGTVEWAGYDDSGYGNYVIINHGDGYKTLYGHCSAVYVSQGQKVKQGQSIAAIGSTGQSTGNHCHFEVRTGDQRSDRQNPLNYVS